MIDEIIKYKNILDSLPSIIERSSKKTSCIIKELKIPQASFYRKLKNRDFYPSEVLTILYLCELPEIENEKIALSIQEGLSQIDSGEFILDQDFKYADKVI